MEAFMRAALRLGLVGLLAAFSFLGMTAAPATAQTPIGPNQHFLGLVNGSDHHPIIYTVCPGPIRPGRTGPVRGGQTLSVADFAKGTGDTGLFSSIYASFVPGSTTPRPPILNFTEYGKLQQIPTVKKWWVPCDGTAQIEFSSCPYLAPCAFGWVPDFVDVTFENIAV